MVLFDINIGSSTPSFVKSVLSWKLTFPQEAQIMWKSLNGMNKRLLQQFSLINKYYLRHPQQYSTVVEAFGVTAPSVWNEIKSKVIKEHSDLVDAFLTIRKTFQALRKYLKELGELSGVEIEPDTMTDVLNEISDCCGVISCGIPGAGGYDAVYCLVTATNFTTLQAVTKQILNVLTSKCKTLNIQPLMLTVER